jgi:AraC-like DNA-binding protein
LTVRELAHRGSSEAGRELWLAESAPSRDALGIAYCGYVESAPIRRLQVPPTDVSLIIGLRDPVHVAFDPVSKMATRVSSFAAGLHESFALVEATGPQCGLQIRLPPLVAFRLLRTPMHLIAGKVVALEDLLGDDGAFLAEQLAELHTWSTRFHHVDALIRRRLSTSPGLPGNVERALEMLRKVDGRVRIAALAKEIGWSRQHLVTTFHEHVGLAPKTVARIYRFQHALRRLERGTESHAEIAHGCGYADQAHFNREFRRCTGSTPLEFLARRFPDGAGVAAGSAARGDATFIQDERTVDTYGSAQPRGTGGGHHGRKYAR